MWNNREYLCISFEINEFNKIDLLIDYLHKAKVQGYDLCDNVMVRPYRELSEKEIIERDIANYKERIKELEQKLE